MWQPIETAPRDGRRLLLAWPKRLVAKVRRVVEKHRKQAKPTTDYMAKHGRSPYDLTD